MSNTLIDNPSSPEARGKRVRFIREHLLDCSRDEFCQNADFTSQALKGWELAWGGGLSPQGAKKIVSHIKKFNIYCTEPWLMHGIGRSAVILTKDLDIREGQESHIAKELLVFRELPNSVDAVVKDDAMLPLLYPGNYVGGIIVNDQQFPLEQINLDLL